LLTRIVRFFTENWTLKLAALALAIMLWLAVRADTPKQAVFRNVPVAVDLRDPDWRLVGDPEPAVVNVTVEGPTPALIDLAGNPPRVVVRVDRVNDTTETQVVPLQWVEFPPGADTRRAQALVLSPDTIRLRYERLASRTLPVEVRTKGDLPEGLALALPIQTNPAAVVVRGPASALARIQAVPLLPVELSGLRSTTNVPARVDTAAVGAALRFDPREVNVVLRVVPTDSQPGLRPDSARLRQGAPL
jgi:YbbR domain-containing protein